MAYAYEISEITKEEALSMVRRYHYSNTLPKLNKHYIGFYLSKKLVGVVTLGWGQDRCTPYKKFFQALKQKIILR